MKNIEGVQCRTTKVIPELRDKPYHERLHSLNMYSMEYRRKGGDMIQAKFKGTRNHSMKLTWIIDDWNSLTEKIVNSESLDIFKGRLDKH